MRPIKPSAPARVAFTLILALAFAAPSATAAVSSDITFYGHVFGTGTEEPNPVNTQYPWGEEDIATSLVTEDPCHPAGTPCEEDPLQKLFLYSTAGPVTLKGRRELDYSKLHNEFGLTQDILLDKTKEVTATLYATPGSTHAWLHFSRETPCPLPTGDPPANVPCVYPYWRWHAGVSPNWHLEATLAYMVLGTHGEGASDRPDVGGKWQSGDYTVIATRPMEPQTTIHLDGYGDYARVWRFDINLGNPVLDRIPSEANYVLFFSWYNDVGGVATQSPMTRINSGEFFPTSFTMPVKNPFTVDVVRPQEIHGKLAITGTINTPWGSYDIDPESVKLTITDGNGRGIDATRIERVASFSVAHGGHYKPVNITYVWDHRADGLKPGKYAATLTATNYQHTASDSTTATFEISKDGRVVNIVAGRKEGAAPLPPVTGSQGNGETGTASETTHDGDAPFLVPIIPPLIGGLVFARTRRWRA